MIRGCVSIGKVIIIIEINELGFRVLGFNTLIISIQNNSSTTFNELLATLKNKF